VIAPFTTDGCSGGMSRIFRLVFLRAPPWEGCCTTHDQAYWKGGTREDRAEADRGLMVCVTENGHPVLAFLMWAAVRIGGHPFWPVSWRWGYGHRWPRRYCHNMESNDDDDREGSRER
jgi:hypothetical protein